MTKRRRATDSDRENSPLKKSNRFSQLDSSPDREKKPPKAKPTKKAPRIPPFNVIIDDIKKTFKDLQSLIKTSCKFPPIIINKPRTQEMAVCAANLEDYRALQKALEEGKFNFYTFKDPTATPPIKVVIRHLPTSTSVEEIKAELMENGFPVQSVAQMRKRGSHNGAPLPLFVVTLDNNETSAKIKELKSLLYVKIAVEGYNKPKAPTQCFKCQRFHHVSGQCRVDERCVKCAGAHASSSCTKTRETPGTCANCGGPHTASYRGCPEYKRVTATINRIVNKSSNSTPKRPNPEKCRDSPPLREPKQKSAQRQPQTQPPASPVTPKTYKDALSSPPKVAPRTINNTPINTPNKHISHETENNPESGTMFEIINHIKQTNQLVQNILSGTLTRTEAIKRATTLCCQLVNLALENGSFV